jgi:zinc-binding alcohol dehydrogenase/oxidoreductase
VYVQVKQTKGQGTFAEYIAVPNHAVVETPSHLKLAEAAAFPLGGVTAYR